MTENGTILIVDDSKTINALIKHALKDLNCSLSSAFTAAQAWELIEEAEPFDLILLDVILPDDIGFNLISKFQLHPKTRNTPVIFLTGVSDVENMQRGLSLGAIDFIQKPFNDLELSLKIKNHFKLLATSCHLRKKEMELQQMLEKQKELNKTKDHLFSIIAHDLKTPFLHLLSIMEINKSESLSVEELNLMLNKISVDFGYTYNMVSNLLEWASTQLKGKTVMPEAFDVATTVHRQTALFSSIAQSKKIRITVELPDKLLAYADPNMTELVIRNLLANAIKFCNPYASITVSGKTDEEWANLSVSDTGVGIAPSDLKGIFEKIGRSTLGTHHEKGTGLGLPLCKDYIERNQGIIEAQSIPGKGSTFAISLPVNKTGSEFYGSLEHQKKAFSLSN